MGEVTDPNILAQLNGGQPPRMPVGGPRGIPGTGPKPPAPPTEIQLREQARQDAEERRAQIKFNAEYNPDGTKKPAPAGSALTATQRGNVTQKLQGLRAIKGQIARVKAAETGLAEDGWGGPVWGNIPGAGTLDPESAVYDKAQATFTSLIRQLTRTPGEGAMSDYESRLAAAIPPARSDNKEARAEAMAGIEELVRGLEAGYAEMLGQAPAAPGGNSTGAPRRRYNPATGKIE